MVYKYCHQNNPKQKNELNYYLRGTNNITDFYNQIEQNFGEFGRNLDAIYDRFTGNIANIDTNCSIIFIYISHYHNLPHKIQVVIDACQSYNEIHLNTIYIVKHAKNENPTI
jgi:RNAse (barnase) inhibitor barstar